MTSYVSSHVRREVRGAIGGAQGGSVRRKVKHYSYGADDCIGKGYSSVVYRGTNDLNGSTVAIKAIDMKGVRDAVSRQMLDCQIEALTKLKHPNILKWYDVVREPSHCFIITEFCNEGDLSSLLKKKKRMTQSEVDSLMRDIVAGFVEIGEKNYLHRDLKLANIFLSEGSAVIADFGFAKKNSRTPQKEKYNVGSPLYMSPEALKKNIYSIKNDIWSIGIMLYELLHGETPWECRTEKELMDKMIRVPVKFKDSLKISCEMKAFIKKCLEVNEDQRMCLSELKLWSTAHPPKHVRRSFSPIDPPPTSMTQSVKQPHIRPLLSRDSLQREIHLPIKETKPLSELTNRLSVRSHSNIPKISVTSGVNKTLDTNRGITKEDIDGNNNALIVEINTFRLLFKINEKLRQYHPTERETINVVGNQVMKRVNQLVNVVCGEGSENTPKNVYSLKCLHQYMDEKHNAGIKKYRSVAKEYLKKYSAEITIAPLGRQTSSKDVLKEMLTMSRVERCSSSEEKLMMLWIAEYCLLKKEVKKEELDAIIQPKKIQINKEYLMNKIKLL